MLGVAALDRRIPMIRTKGLARVHLRVDDLDRSTQFYQQVFGMQELFREGPDTVSLRTPGTTDMITLHRREAGEETGTMGNIAHFGFQLEGGVDIDSAILEVEAAGGRILERGTRGTRADRYFGMDLYAYVADPDGYIIEI
jgi:catechol 2,3-dioxygenase-like lactoylglutathione lyase family enzyme